MSGIYRKAERVLAWLGTRHDIMLNHTRTYYFAVLIILEQNTRERHGRTIRGFFDNPYFHRLWVIQELGLARKKHFLVGDRWLAADSLLNYLKNATGIFVHYPMRRHTLERMISSSPITMPLNRALTVFPAMKCSEPRDRAYAFWVSLKELLTSKWTTLRLWKNSASTLFMLLQSAMSKGVLMGTVLASWKLS